MVVIELETSQATATWTALLYMAERWKRIASETDDAERRAVFENEERQCRAAADVVQGELFLTTTEDIPVELKEAG